MANDHTDFADAVQLRPGGIRIIQRRPLAAAVDETVGKCGAEVKIRTYNRALVASSINEGCQRARIVEVDDAAIAPTFEAMAAIVSISVPTHYAVVLIYSRGVSAVNTPRLIKGRKVRSAQYEPR